MPAQLERQTIYISKQTGKCTVFFTWPTWQAWPSGLPQAVSVKGPDGVQPDSQVIYMVCHFDRLTMQQPGVLGPPGVLASEQHNARLSDVHTGVNKCPKQGQHIQ